MSSELCVGTVGKVKEKATVGAISHAYGATVKLTHMGDIENM